jgi:hypothetical protein
MKITEIEDIYTQSTEYRNPAGMVVQGASVTKHLVEVEVVMAGKDFEAR